jgi:hypothetical protein
MSDTRDQPRKDRPLPDWKNVFVECLQEREMALFFPDGPSADPSDVFDAALVAVKAMAKPPRTETLRAYYAMGLVLRLCECSRMDAKAFMGAVVKRTNYAVFIYLELLWDAYDDTPSLLRMCRALPPAPPDDQSAP